MGQINNILMVVTILVVVFCGFSQTETGKFKAQLALGVNNPSSEGFVEGFKGKTVNFPTVQFGLQYMVLGRFGAKLDYGFNRIASSAQSLPFKLNYSRINVQMVYDTTKWLALSPRIGAFVHAGPGWSKVVPLGVYGGNKTSFLNVLGGLELHYGLSDSLTIFADTSYNYAFGKEFSPISSGFGAFNGNLLAVTFGLSISLSGCYFCGN